MSIFRRWRRLRIVIPLILLAMVLARMTWMQLRDYPHVADARTLLALAALRELPEQAACGGLEFDGGGAMTLEPLATAGGLGKRTDELRGAPTQLGTAEPTLGAAAAATAGLSADSLRAVRLWLAGPGRIAALAGACASSLLDERHVLRLNQWLLGASVLVCVMLTRIVTSSWTVALMVSAMLLSRGRLLADLSLISADWIMTLVVSVWFAAVAHFVRSGSRLIMALAALALVVATAIDLTAAGLALVPCVLLIFGRLFRRRLEPRVMKRLDGDKRTHQMGRRRFSAWPEAEVESFFGRLASRIRWMLGIEFVDEPDTAPATAANYRPGGLLRTLELPFLLWVYHRRLWLILAIVWLAIGALAVLLTLFAAKLLGGDAALALAAAQALGRDLQILAFNDLSLLLSQIDLHLSVSILIIIVCALQSPGAGLRGFSEVAWVTIIGSLTLLALGMVLDWRDSPLIDALALGERGAIWRAAQAPRRVLLWLEPVLLSLGVAGIQNLMRVFDTRVAERR